MIMIIILIVLLLSLIVSIFINYNLLKKVERYEEDIILKDEFLEKFQKMTSESYHKMAELDHLQAFESDDEIGFVFKNIKDIILMLDTYMKNYSK